MCTVPVCVYLCVPVCCAFYIHMSINVDSVLLVLCWLVCGYVCLVTFKKLPPPPSSSSSSSSSSSMLYTGLVEEGEMERKEDEKDEEDEEDDDDDEEEEDDEDEEDEEEPFFTGESLNRWPASGIACVSIPVTCWVNEGAVSNLVLILLSNVAEYEFKSFSSAISTIFLAATFSKCSRNIAT